MPFHWREYLELARSRLADMFEQLIVFLVGTRRDP